MRKKIISNPSPPWNRVVLDEHFWFPRPPPLLSSSSSFSLHLSHSFSPFNISVICPHTHTHTHARTHTRSHAHTHTHISSVNIVGNWYQWIQGATRRAMEDTVIVAENIQGNFGQAIKKKEVSILTTAPPTAHFSSPPLPLLLCHSPPKTQPLPSLSLCSPVPSVPENTTQGSAHLSLLLLLLSLCS